MLAFLASCSGSSEERLNAEMQTALSWAATAQMVMEEWLRGSVTSAYARRTLAKSQQALAAERRKIEGIRAGAGENEEARTFLLPLEDAMRDLSAAVETTDRKLARDRLDAFRSLTAEARTAYPSPSSRQ